MGCGRCGKLSLPPWGAESRPSGPGAVGRGCCRAALGRGGRCPPLPRGSPLEQDRERPTLKLCLVGKSPRPGGISLCSSANRGKGRLWSSSFP